MIINEMRPVRPGEILRKEYRVPLNMGAHALTEKFGVTQARINEIVEGQRSITPEIALRLARCFGGGAHSLVNLQTTDDSKTRQPPDCP